jgi:hypothetical protein
LVWPFDGDAMSRVFAANPRESGEKKGPDSLETNQADSRDGATANQLGTKLFGKVWLDDVGSNPIVEKKASPDDSFDRGNLHGLRYFAT